jgi:hypothetical protein
MEYDPNKYASSLDDLRWLAVDLDGTLAEPVYPLRGIGKPIPAGVNYCREMTDKGLRIIIHTSRSWEDYEGIERWLNDHDIPFKAIVCGKLLALRYIDDRGDYPSWL